jgi:hypothetical protein
MEGRACAALSDQRRNRQRISKSKAPASRSDITRSQPRHRRDDGLQCNAQRACLDARHLRGPKQKGEVSGTSECLNLGRTSGWSMKREDDERETEVVKRGGVRRKNECCQNFWPGDHEEKLPCATGTCDWYDEEPHVTNSCLS